MATTKSAASLIPLMILAFAALCSQSAAQTDCTNVLISMSPCLNYITGNSSTPSSQCCSQLSSVVRSSPQCLCQVMNGGGSSLGIDENQTQAMALPRACNVQTPPVSRCNAGAPSDSPSGSTDSPTTVPSDSGPGSKTVPSTEGNGTSHGSSIEISLALVASFLFAASFGSVLAAH